MSVNKFETSMKARGRGCNYEHYRTLQEEIKHKRLVCFFGAGLSHYSNSWGDPFGVTINYLIREIKLLIFDFKENITNLENTTDPDEKEKALEIVNQTKQKIIKLNCQLNTLDRYLTLFNKNEYTGNEFLELGDNLEHVFDELNELDFSANRKHSFNEDCRDTMEKKRTDVLNSRPNPSNCEFYKTNPYGIPAIFYLPYFMNYLNLKLITTNVDMCFDDVCDELGIKMYSRILPIGFSSHPIDTWRKHDGCIFYLHGHVSEYRDMVMTGSAYSKAYDVNHTEGACGILDNIARNKSVLFMGASLNGDRTVEVLNNANKNPNGERIDQDGNRLYYISVHRYRAMSGEPNIDLKYHSPMYMNEFDDYQIFIHMLLRETAYNIDNLYKRCSWLQDLPSDDNVSVEERYVEDFEYSEIIDNSLNSDNQFETIRIDSSERQVYNQLLSYLYFRYLIYSSNDTSDIENKWSLCRIKRNRFDIRGELPLHNLPLGNTIYVFESGLDDSNNNAITKKDAERITNEIKKWLENDYQNYENTFAQPIKIRVIIPGLPNYADPQTIAERQDLNDEVLSAAILLEIEKLKEMRSDFYNDIWEEIKEINRDKDMERLIKLVDFLISRLKATLDDNTSLDKTESKEKIYVKKTERRVTDKNE